MQTRPRCWRCHEVIEYDPIYEPPCGHEEHASAVWHGICLMEWRDMMEHLKREARARWLEEHAEHDPGREP